MLKIRHILFATLILSGSISPSFGQDSLIPPTPNSLMTPGDRCSLSDPDFASLRYQQQIAWCKRNVTRGDRDKIYDAYNIPERCRDNYTIDHFIPLSMGGSNSPKNLWPEHKKIKALRQDLELVTFQKLDANELTQEDAINTIVTAKIHPPAEAYDVHDACAP